MTGIDRATIEERLTYALATMPSPDSLARLDERVYGAIEAPAPRHAWLQRLVGDFRLRIAVVAMLIVGITAAAGGATLLDRLFTNYSGWDKAWDRSEPIRLSQTIDGRRVTVERAYMDVNQIIVGVSARGDDDLGASLRVDGRPTQGIIAVGNQRKHDSAVGFTFLTPPGVGQRARLELDIRPVRRPGLKPGSDAGPWRYVFGLSNAGGVSWTGNQTVEASGVSMTLDELVVSPTMVRGHLIFDGPRVHAIKDVWSPIGAVVRGEKRARLAVGHPARGKQEYTFFTEDGFDAERGTWKVRIDHLTADGDRDIGQQMLTIKGPWVFEVDFGD